MDYNVVGSWRNICLLPTEKHADSTFIWSVEIYKHPVINLMTLSQLAICLFCYSSAAFFLSSFALFHITVLLSSSLFVLLHRIRQAKVQILPERILPDPLSAVQPLSRLLIQPFSKPQTQSHKQALCWLSTYQQVSHTHTSTQHTCAAVKLNIIILYNNTI